MLTNDETWPVIVSIDFGTTYSGCSYALSGQSDMEVSDIIKWPKSNGFYAKVPTLLYYRDKNSKVLDWGRGARLLSLRPDQNGTLFQYFKLALVQPEDVPLPKGKTSLVVISDYLRLFHEYICEEIQKATLFKSFNSSQYRYCLTVPAIWSDESKAIMREAMIKANIIDRGDPIDRLHLISEPEAAAAYCENKYKSWDLTHGDTFMIIDAGGGTLDLITYLIEDVGSRRTLKEVTRGHGGMCGSAFIDENMRKLLQSKLKRNTMYDDESDTIPLCMFEIIMDTFVSQIKPNFNPDDFEEDYCRIDVPAGALPYIPMRLLDDDNRMLFEIKELREKVFEPVLNQVIHFVKEQLATINEFINAVFLVGGFGCSEYLYKMLINQVMNKSIIGEIVMPPQAELAIARGAVYHLLKPNLVTSKLLRRTYGVQTRLPFEEGLDPESSAIITKDGIKRCSTRFDVIGKKGQRINVDQSIKRSYWIEYPKHTEADLYVTNEDEIPRQVTDKSVTKLTEIPVKMPLLADTLPGTKIDVTIEFIFGFTELRIVITLADIKTEHVLESNDYFFT